jgi:anionic glutamate receptor
MFHTPIAGCSTSSACRMLSLLTRRKRSFFTIWILQEYSVQLTFREQWLDERLKFNDFGGRLKYLTLTEASRVWMPDLFFSNEKEGHFHNIIMPNVYIRIFPYGSVLYSIR